MSDSTQEQLLGYALGALDDSERASVEEAMANDPGMRAQLAEVDARLRPLECLRQDFDPPPGLAERTIRRVSALKNGRGGSRSRRQAMSPVPAAAHWIGKVRWPDVAVGIVACAGLVLLLLPAIQGSRFMARVNACQDNLRQLGLALGGYSQVHGDYFPGVPAHGRTAVAGIYAPTLLRSGFLSENRAVICPASMLNRQDGFHVPTLDEVEAAPQENLADLQCTMGGSYGYCLGYMQDGTYHDNKNLHRKCFALAADMPSSDPGHQSRNHDGRGQNVLFEDGRVEFLPTSKIAETGDDIFVNDAGLVAAGMHADDAVVAPSAVGPLCPIGPQQR